MRLAKQETLTPPWHLVSHLSTAVYSDTTIFQDIKISYNSNGVVFCLVRSHTTVIPFIIPFQYNFRLYIVFPEIIEKNIAYLISNLHSLLLINDIATPIIKKDNSCTNMTKL